MVNITQRDAIVERKLASLADRASALVKERNIRRELYEDERQHLLAHDDFIFSPGKSTIIFDSVQPEMKRILACYPPDLKVKTLDAMGAPEKALVGIKVMIEFIDDVQHTHLSYFSRGFYIKVHLTYPPDEEWLKTQYIKVGGILVESVQIPVLKNSALYYHKSSSKITMYCGSQDHSEYIQDIKHKL